MEVKLGDLKLLISKLIGLVPQIRNMFFHAKEESSDLLKELILAHTMPLVAYLPLRPKMIV